MKLTCRELWLRNVELFPDKPAVVDGSRRLTYSQLNERANRLYWALRERGVGKGDRVAILSYNSAEYMELRVTCEKTGLVGVPLNWRQSPDTIAFMIEDSGSKALLLHPDFLGPLEPFLSSFKGLDILVLDTPSDGHPWENYEEALCRARPDEPEDPLLGDDDLLYIIYTGGTTGRPKGVMFHQRMQVEEGKGHIYALDLREWDVALNVMPWFHSGGHALSSAVAYVGGTNVILPKFDPRQFLETVQRERVTVTQLVPTMIAMLLEQPDIDRYDLSSLRTIQYVGAPMPESLLRKAMDRFGEDRFVQCYGLTEFGPLATRLSKEDHRAAMAAGASEKAKNRLKSVGCPLYYVRARIVNDHMHPQPPGHPGEIALRGETMTKGYWNRPDLTEQRMKGGWLLTGDIGLMDEDGYLYLLDRKDDMIISGGENVYPARVEEVLCGHPAVKEAAVVGLPDEKWGERVVAAVSLWPGASVTEEELIEFCRPRLAGYERPKAIFILPDLPKSPAGKILRREVKKKLQGSS